jgi:glycerol-3-phosphate cytidylyltransferase-like family protein
VIIGGIDTGSKILRPEETASYARQAALGGRNLQTVVGCFDPLLAAHARRILEIADGGTLLVAIITSEGDILPGRARAELVAALAPVDAVTVLPREDVEPFVSGLPPGRVHREEDRHNSWRLELIERVRNRYGK